MSWLPRIRAKAGLDLPTMILMLKGSLPPLIGISMYQSTAVSTYFTTEGYLIPIISVLAVAILPRDKFIQNLILSVLLICVGSAISLLAIWSSIQARTHTSPAAAQPPPTAAAPLPYNSSQSAVCAVWLFVNIWLANLVRAKMPAFNLPVVIYSILVNTCLTTGPAFGTTTAAKAFVRELLCANLIGMGLATGVCVLIFPFNSRTIVVTDFRRLIGLLRGMVHMQGDRLARSTQQKRTLQGEQQDTEEKEHQRSPAGPQFEINSANRLSEAADEVRRLAGKLYEELPFARRDVAWGKLQADDISDIFTLLYNITIPLMAICTGIRILESDGVGGPRKTRGNELAELQNKQASKGEASDDVNEQMQLSFQALGKLVDQGLEHAGLCLEILPRPPKRPHEVVTGGPDRTNVDLEVADGQIYPGDVRFAAVINEKISGSYAKSNRILRSRLNELLMSFENVDSSHTQARMADTSLSSNLRRLCVLMYLQRLTLAATEAVQCLIVFTDEKVNCGIMEHKRLILPSRYLLWNWLRSILKKRGPGTSRDPDVLETNPAYYANSYTEKKDPERLPPKGIWQHIGTGLCRFSGFLGSRESAFGFRVACAAMSISILAFLKATQSFFQQQRLLWAMFTISLGMTITSGQSIFGFCCRVGGTLLAMVFSLAIWYIPDQKTPGIIVILWLFIFIEYYFVKFPRLVSTVIITVTTQLVIVGYELQVRKLGEDVATRSGQPYYPIYLLGPYRLAVIAGGSLVAFFWTFFPCALTDRTWIRQDLSAMMYLLGNYFSVLNATIKPLLEDGPRAGEFKSSRIQHLTNVRRKIFGKLTRTISSIESHIMWQRWEPAVGGSFPSQTYQEIFVSNTHVAGYLMLMSYAMAYGSAADKIDELEENGGKSGQEATGDVLDGIGRHWDSPHRWPSVQVLRRVELTDHTILSTLIMLSNALFSGQRLPPFLPIPEHQQMARRLVWLAGIDTPTGPDEDGKSKAGCQCSGSQSDLGLALVDLRQRRRSSDEENGQISRHSFRCQRRGDNPSLSRQVPLMAERRLYFMTQVCSSLICDELEDLARAVSKLVGIVDFSLHNNNSNGKRGSIKPDNVDVSPIERIAAVKGKAVEGIRQGW